MVDGLSLAASAFSMGDVLSPYIYVFYSSFVIAFIFTPVMRKVAMHYGIIDQPDGLRKIHREPVAYLGGAAVFLGWMVGVGDEPVSASASHGTGSADARGAEYRDPGRGRRDRTPGAVG